MEEKMQQLDPAMISIWAQISMMTDESVLELKNNIFEAMKKVDRALIYNLMVANGIDPHDLRGVNE